MTVPQRDPIEYAHRINRKWLTKGELANNAERYLDQLAAIDPELLREVCEFAIAEARRASSEQRDPKPNFYAALFSRASRKERDEYLREHFFTRLLSAEYQLSDRLPTVQKL